MKQNAVMNSEKLSLLLESIMIVCMIVTAAMLIALPFVLWDIIVLVSRQMVYENPDNYRWLMLCLYPALLTALIVLNEVRRIFHTVRKDTPFCAVVSRGLKHISICAFVLAFLCLAKFVVIPGLITGLLIFAFLLAALCFLVLAEVFDKAVSLKNENDLTI